MVLTVEFSQAQGTWRCEIKGIPSTGSVTAYRQTQDEAVRHAISDAFHVIAACLRQGTITEIKGGIQFVFVHGHTDVP